MKKFIEIFPRKCMATGKGMHVGYLAFDTETYSTQDLLVTRLREAAGNPTNIYEEPLTDDFILDHEWPDDWMYTHFPFDEQDDDGNAIGYTADGQPVNLNTISTWGVRYPLHEEIPDEGVAFQDYTPKPPTT